MVKSRRVFTREFKLAAIKELDSGKPLGMWKDFPSCSSECGGTDGRVETSLETTCYGLIIHNLLISENTLAVA